MIAQDQYNLLKSSAKLLNASATQGHLGRNCSWVTVIYNGDFTIIPAGGRVYASTIPVLAVTDSRKPLTPDYDVADRLYVASLPAGQKSQRLIGRADPAHGNPQADTHYGIDYDVNTASWRLMLRSAGTDAAPLDTAAVPGGLAIGSSPKRRIRFRGNVIEGYIDDALTLSATDSTITGTGSYGLFYTGTAQSETVGLHSASMFSATNAWEADASLADRGDDPSGTLLETHISDSGAHYAQHPAHAGLGMDIRNTLINGAKASSLGGMIRAVNAGAAYIAVDGAGTALSIPNDFDCDLVFDALGSPLTSFYFTFRGSPTADSFYYVGYNKPQTRWEFGKMVSGTPTTTFASGTSTYVNTPAANDRYLVEVSVRGNNFVMKLKGTERLNVTDSSSPFTSGAVGFWAPQAAATTTGIHLQNVYVRAPLSAPSDTVYFDGDSTADGSEWSDFPPNDYDFDSSFWGRVNPFGSTAGACGVGGQYQSITRSTILPPGFSGTSARYEVRAGDWAYAREKAMNKVRSTICMGMDDWDLYIGFALYVPGNQAIGTGSASTDASSQEIFATHQNQDPRPVGDPGIETGSLKLTGGDTWKLNCLAGWEDQIAGQIYTSSFNGQLLGPVNFDGWNYFVFHYLMSADPGVGRIECWFSADPGAWVAGDQKFGPYPASTMDYSRSSYLEIGWYRTPRGCPLPNRLHRKPFKVGNTFAAVDPKVP